MGVIAIIIASLLPLALAGSPFRAMFPQHDGHVLQTGVDPGSPLFLTPYIEKGQIDKARNLSMVGLKGVPVLSYSGFVTVNKTYDSNMFFWMFPAQHGAEDAPLLLWLQGGPGGSSLFGTFVENGPFGVDKNLKLFLRKFSWTQTYNVLYIDNPVQTGFSFTKDDQGFATNEYDVAENLYKALVQIFQLFPEYKDSDFYLTGESYAGKYIPALSHRIHNDRTSKINLKGAAIGDGFSDPPVMIYAYADFLYQTGLLDSNQAQYFHKQMEKVGQLIDQGKFVDAFHLNNKVFGDFTNTTGLEDMYNYLRTKSPEDFQYYNGYLALPEVRRAIHVGNLTYNSGSAVEDHLQADMLQSVKPWLAELMDNYRVLIYTGQLDIIVALPLTEAMLQTVPWSGLKQYQLADRTIWKVRPEDTEVAGYVRRVKNFYQVLVRAGGHILPYDQPERAFDMIHRFLSGKF